MALLVKYKPDGTPVLVPEDGQEWKSYDEMFGSGAWERSEKRFQSALRRRAFVDRITGVFGFKIKWGAVLVDW